MSKNFVGDAARHTDIGSRKMAIAGILTAMTVVATVFTKIPSPLPQGYFNLGDTIVLIAGAIFGSMTGAFAGAVGSAAADILTGGLIFAPITLIVKGAEGYIAGKISGLGNARAIGAAGHGAAGHGAAEHGDGAKTAQDGAAGASAAQTRPNSYAGRVLRGLTPALIVGAAVMVAGYFLAEATVLSFIDQAFGFGAALAELPINIAQGCFSVLLARAAIEGMKRFRII